MKLLITACALGLFFALPAWALHPDSVTEDQPHDHQPIGQPADGAPIDRTIEVVITETSSGYMLFEPDAIQIETGSVVRFVIDNSGGQDHEFFLGSFDEIAEHQQWLHKHPEMEHDDANAVFIGSGDTAELVWQFSTMTNLEFVCLIPGHREAGMWGVIIVHDHLAPNRLD